MPRPCLARSVLFAVPLLVLAACGDTAARPGVEDTAGVTTPTSATPTGGSTSPSGDASFPVTVADDSGEVTVAAAPQRIVSLSASLTEILYAVGAGEQVVAVDRYSNHPRGTPMTDLSGFRPNVEAIAAHQPDLVLVSSDRDGIVDALGAAGVPTVLLTSAATLEDTYRAIEVVGAVTGHPDRAAATVDQIRAEVELLADSVRRRETPVRYYYELSGDHHSVTSATYIGELLRLAGLESIADAGPDAAGGYPQLNAEFVLAADPEVIFLARTDAGAGAADVAARPGWGELTAVREGWIVQLDPDLASRWGPRVADLLEQVIAATAEVG